MAIMGLYLVFDRATNEHLPPLLAPTELALKRMCERAVNGGDKNMTQYPDSYDIKSVGKMDTITGNIESWPPVHLFCAKDLVKAPAVEEPKS